MQFKQQIPNAAPFGQQNVYSNQLNNFPMQIPATNPLLVNQPQIPVNPSSLGSLPNALGNCVQMGPINHLNGVPNPAVAMPQHMVRTN